MAGQTPRFALNFFGGDSPGTFDEDNEKYTSEDRLTLDTILAALETHSHRVTSTLDAPGEPPLLAVTENGILQGGTTYCYVVSFVNAQGLETVSGDEVSIDTPALLQTPQAPQADTGDDVTYPGTLAPGMYYYALTALRDGEESALGPPTAVSVTASDGGVHLTLPDSADATTMQVWRMKDTDPGWTRIDTGVPEEVVHDDGHIPAGVFGNPLNIPPSINTGVDKYSITVTLTGSDLSTVLSSQGWRIYRTTVSGAYSATALVHEVIERTNDLNPNSPLLISWLDDGDAPLTGSPRLFSTELNIPPLTFEFATTLPVDVSAYPENYPILAGDGILYVNKSSVWTPISGGGGGTGVATFTGHGPPVAAPVDAVDGDIYIDLDTGDIYQFSGL